MSTSFHQPHHTSKEVPATGAEVIHAYVKLEKGSLARYHQLFKALDLFAMWDDQTKIAYLSEFFTLYEVLDADCSEIVQKLCDIRWHTVPESIRQKYVDFLTSLAIHQVFHVEGVLRCVISHFLPIGTSLALGGEEQLEVAEDALQLEVYEMAHHCLDIITLCNPMAMSVVLRLCAKTFPHVRLPTPRLMAYLRNMLIFSERQSGAVAADLWVLIIDRLIQLDASITTRQLELDGHGHGHGSGGANVYDTDEIFHMDDEQDVEGGGEGLDGRSLSTPSQLDEVIVPEEYVKDPSPKAKLDLCMAMILMYSSPDVKEEEGSTFGAFKQDINFAWLFSPRPHRKTPSVVYGELVRAFDEHLLYAYDVHSVSYLWFHLCALSKDNCQSMLRFLWDTIKRPILSPNEWKKCHNAAAFLSAFLARANYVSFDTASTWLKKMAQWCCNYVDEVEILRSASTSHQLTGGIQHGTFYSTVQALLFTFCYRYTEFEDHCGEVHLWGLGRIIHSRLEPLRFISQAVAMCFANVSRHLRIVYCNHILSSEETLKRRPHEIYFPFSFCQLKICSHKILPMMRRFTSAEEDNLLPSKVAVKAKAVKAEEVDDYDFMMMFDEEEEIEEMEAIVGVSPKAAKLIMETPLNHFTSEMSPSQTKPKYMRL